MNTVVSCESAIKHNIKIYGEYYNEMNEYINKKEIAYASLKNETNKVLDNFYSGGETNSTREVEQAILEKKRLYDTKPAPTVGKQYDVRCCLNNEYLYNTDSESCLPPPYTFNTFIFHDNILKNIPSYKLRRGYTPLKCTTECLSDPKCNEVLFEKETGKCEFMEKDLGIDYDIIENFGYSLYKTPLKIQSTSKPPPYIRPEIKKSDGMSNESKITIGVSISAILLVIILGLTIFYLYYRKT